jgi:hypothetical protein
MKLIYYFSFFLAPMLCASILYGMDTTPDLAQQAEAQVSRLFPEPQNLHTAKKLNSEIKEYLAQLQQAATLLAVQAYFMDTVDKQITADTRYLESRKRAAEFRPTTTELLEQQPSGVCCLSPVPTTTMALLDTLEASIILLRYQSLFSNNKLEVNALDIICPMLQSDNREVRDLGAFLFNKLSVHFYDTEVAKLAQDIKGGLIAVFNYYRATGNLSALPHSSLGYLKYGMTIMTMWLSAVTQDTQTNSLKTVRDNWRDYDQKAHEQRINLLKLYRIQEKELYLLYTAILNRLTTSIKILLCNGNNNRDLVLYKKNKAFNIPHPQSWAFSVYAPQTLESYIEYYTAKATKQYEYIDSSFLSRPTAKSNKRSQSFKLVKSIHTTDIQLPEIDQSVDFITPENTATLENAQALEQACSQEVKTSNSVIQTARYYCNESNPLYIEIYDRQDQCRFILYRLIDADSSLEHKPYTNFSYDKRVAEWFTNPQKRLTEDGYTTEGHPYFAQPHDYSWKVLLHAFAPLIDDYMFLLGYESPSPKNEPKHKNIRVLGELHAKDHETKYVYFTYNLYPHNDGHWHCNHRCIEIKPKSEFLATKLDQAKLAIHFPKLATHKKPMSSSNSNSNGNGTQ